MTYATMQEAQQRAIEAARAVPGVRWTIQLPEARITYWTDVEGGWVNHTSLSVEAQEEARKELVEIAAEATWKRVPVKGTRQQEREAQRRKRAPKGVAAGNETTPAPVLPEAGARPKSTKGSIAHG